MGLLECMRCGWVGCAVFVGYKIVECDVARGQLIFPGCWYYIQRILTARQLKLPSGTHTNFYVTKVGYISTTDYVLQKHNYSYVLHKRNVPM